MLRMVHAQLLMRLTTYILAVLLAAASWSIGTGQPPTEAALQAEVARLIRQLDADRYEQREQASLALRQIGTPALAALRQARQHASMEVRCGPARTWTS